MKLERNYSDETLREVLISRIPTYRTAVKPIGPLKRRRLWNVCTCLKRWLRGRQKLSSLLKRLLWLQIRRYHPPIRWRAGLRRSLRNRRSWKSLQTRKPSRSQPQNAPNSLCRVRPKRQETKWHIDEQLINAVVMLMWIRVNAPMRSYNLSQQTWSLLRNSRIPIYIAAVKLPSECGGRQSFDEVYRTADPEKVCRGKTKSRRASICSK